MKRIGLLIGTNLAILLVLSLTLRLLGIDSYLQQSDTSLNLNALLVFAAIFGFGGSFLSLLMSKWMAKKLTAARIIEQPANQD
ncbi:MAG: heat shock protein HtpX [Gammaproteobacteria bacterium]|jgi:heat shock protein HtpX